MRRRRPEATCDDARRPRRSPEPGHDILGRVAVVVTGTGGRHRLRELPAVEDAGCDEAESALRAEGEQLVERRLLEERITQEVIRWPSITRLQDV